MVGVFLAIVGLSVIPEMIKAGTDNGEWGILVDAQVPNVELGLHRLQHNDGLPGAAATVGLDRAMAQPRDSDGADE